MVNVLISGALGRMGRKVAEASLSFPEVKIVCGVDIKDAENSFPIYSSFDKVKEKVDVVIDFSLASNLKNVLSFIKKNNSAAVLCTTGYNEQDLAEINEASKLNAIFRSANMSLGVNVIIELVKKATKALYGFDVEIIEKHHNKKKDAPSGTALMLADAVKEIDSEKYYTYGRSGIVGERDKNEIGIHAIRGGNIVGEHQVIFAGENETITISHEATDRAVFAFGAVKAAIFLKDKSSGLYNMSDMLK